MSAFQKCCNNFRISSKNPYSIPSLFGKAAELPDAATVVLPAKRGMGSFSNSPERGPPKGGERHWRQEGPRQEGPRALDGLCLHFPIVVFAHEGKVSKWNMARPQLLTASVMHRTPMMFITIPVLACKGWGRDVKATLDLHRVLARAKRWSKKRPSERPPGMIASMHPP